jgi:hypothetical protein
LFPPTLLDSVWIYWLSSSTDLCISVLAVDGIVLEDSQKKHQKTADLKPDLVEIIMPENNKLLISQSFNSFEELAVIAHSWNADFRQFSPSETDHQILQVMMDGILMSRGRFGCHLDQHGSTPADLRTFALLEENCTPVYWFGRKAGPDTLLVFPTHGEIEAVSRPGFCNHTFSVSMDDLGNFFERSGGPDISRVLGPGAAGVPIPYVHLQRLRAHLRKISFDQVTLHQSLALYDAYRDKLFGILQDILNG